MEAVFWPSMDPQDVDPVEFDFSIYAGSATLTGVVVSAEVVRGTDPSPSSILLGSPSVNGKVVYQMISNPKPGVTYKVRALGSFSDSRQQVLAGTLPCVRR